MSEHYKDKIYLDEYHNIKGMDNETNRKNEVINLVESINSIYNISRNIIVLIGLSIIFIKSVTPLYFFKKGITNTNNLITSMHIAQKAILNTLFIFVITAFIIGTSFIIKQLIIKRLMIRYNIDYESINNQNKKER